jgi:hypothetical protein
MPSLVPLESSTFSVEGGKALVQWEGFRDTDASGWSLLRPVTLVVVDGPGDQGFLLARLDRR